MAVACVRYAGCDTGFGHELAKRLDADGYQVLAGCLNPSSEGAVMLKDFCSPSLRVVHLDVTREDHVRRAAKTIAGELGLRRTLAQTNVRRLIPEPLVTLGK